MPDDFPDINDPEFHVKAGLIWDRLGRPKGPDGYKWSDDPEFGPLNDVDISYRQHIGKLGHRIGISTWQMRELEKGQYGFAKAQRDAQKAIASVNDERTHARTQIQRITREAMAKGLDPTSKAWPHYLLDPLYKKAHGSKQIRQDGGWDE